MILTLSRNISNPDLSCDEFGSRPNESDSRVGPKYADSTRGLSSMIRDSKIFRAARGLSLLTQPVTPGRRGRTQTRPVATLRLLVDGIIDRFSRRIRKVVNRSPFISRLRDQAKW